VGGDALCSGGLLSVPKPSCAGKATLIELHGDRRWSLYPHLEAFGDGVGLLRRAIGDGLLDVLRPPVNSRDEFARRLLAIGLVDRSDRPLPSPKARGPK